jgi:uncharacterized protein (TIGR03086 family)
MDAIETLKRASEEYRSRLWAVQAAWQWASPTPWDEWTVRDVADHILGGNRFTFLILGGLPSESAMDRVTHGDFGEDPGRAFERSSADQLSAFGQPGVLERMYEHPMGLLSGRQIARLRMSDLVVHAWDLARALGLPEGLDPLLVTESIAVVRLSVKSSSPPGFSVPGQVGSWPTMRLISRNSWTWLAAGREPT